VCRDPDDNKFLEVAVSSAADYLVSQDDDLLTLSCFEGIPIIRPADFPEQLEHEKTDI
jgi:predicted nucleic acid-binding protein